MTQIHVLADLNHHKYLNNYFETQRSFPSGNMIYFLQSVVKDIYSEIIIIVKGVCFLWNGSWNYMYLSVKLLRKCRNLVLKLEI